MATLKGKIGQFVPEPLKAMLRPLYADPVPEYASDRSSQLAIGSFEGFEVAYRKNTADRNVLKESFAGDLFFPRVPEYKPAAGHIIIDVGAHIGTFSLLAASKIPGGKVYSIEACEDTFNFLRINAALNRSDIISVHHLAIADKKGTIRLHYDTGNWGHSVVSQLSESGETVACETLSDFMAENKIAHCDFMKLNCEGAEFPIILGTPPEVLKRCSIILVLYHCDLWKKNTELDLVAHLESGGFHCSVHPTDPNTNEFVKEEDLSKYGRLQRGWITATQSAGKKS